MAPPRKIDRGRLALMLDAGATCAEMAAAFGVTGAAVRLACRQIGRPLPGPRNGFGGRRRVKVGGDFGRLVVLRDSGTRDGRWAVWTCRCDPDRGGCGRIIPVRNDHLLSGGTRSCGCLLAETCAATGRRVGPRNIRRAIAARRGP